MNNEKIEIKLQLNQYQLGLLRDWVSGAQDNLHDQRVEWGEEYITEQEDHLLVYGTTDYEEAQALLDDIQNQLGDESRETAISPEAPL